MRHGHGCLVGALSAHDMRCCLMNTKTQFNKDHLLCLDHNDHHSIRRPWQTKYRCAITSENKNREMGSFCLLATKCKNKTNLALHRRSRQISYAFNLYHHCCICIRNYLNGVYVSACSIVFFCSCRVSFFFLFLPIIPLFVHRAMSESTNNCNHQITNTIYLF